MSGNDQEHPPTDAEQPPDEAFALVGHEIRAEIIDVLAPELELSLSELRSRLDADVDPSQLHYHLEKLVGHFVRKTDDGYKLNGVGTRLAWTLQAGSYDRQEEDMAVDANFDCHKCQAPVDVCFTTGRVRITCPACDHHYMLDYYNFPIDKFEDRTCVFSHFKQYQILKMFFMARKVCFVCGNRLDPVFFDPNELGSLDQYENFDVVIVLDCDQCGAGWWQSVGMALRADPGLISFCYDHGVDILSTPHWELEFAMTDEHVTVRSTDPWEVALAVTFDDDTLELVVDDELNLLERNRLDASDQGNASLLRGIQTGVRLVDSMEETDEVDLPDNAACLEYLRRDRWPDGVICPHCDSPNTIKKGTTSKDAQRYRCQDCESIFNDLTGTIFAEYGLSLPEMFYIIQELEATDATQLARQLDRSYQTVLDFIHEVQDALAETSDTTMSSA